MPGEARQRARSLRPVATRPLIIGAGAIFDFLEGRLEERFILHPAEIEVRIATFEFGPGADTDRDDARAAAAGAPDGRFW